VIIVASSSITYRIYAPPVAADDLALPHLRTWLPVLVFGLIFAVESSTYLGADHTSEPLRRVCEWIFGMDACVHWSAIHHAIRKTGHFLGYGIFALLCFRAFWISFERAATQLVRQLRAHGLAIVTTFLAAGADELHQSFLPNRTGQFSDVLLDTCGGAALCLLLFVAMQMAEKLPAALKRHSSRRAANVPVAGTALAAEGM
jgi:VanZ family protein